MYRFEGEDRVEFAKVMAALGAVYDREITPELIRGYELALHDVPILKVKSLALQHMQASKWFPRPSELRPKSDYRQRWERLAAEGSQKVIEDETRRKQWLALQGEPNRIEYAGLNDE